MHVIAAKAVCFKEAMSPTFKAYQHQIRLNAAAMAERFTELGVRLVSGGTDNHLMLVNLISLGINGKQAQEALDEAGITVNKNSIPFDTQKPFLTSGIRIGTPALTTRGMQEPEMKTIADIIYKTLTNYGDESVRREVLGVVGELCNEFPLYG
jgi:glycine hydroxymethyltransferase